MSPQRITLVVVILALLALAVYLVWSRESASQRDTYSSTQYQNPVHGFAFRYPQRWSQEPSNQDGVLAVFVAPGKQKVLTLSTQGTQQPFLDLYMQERGITPGDTLERRVLGNREALIYHQGDSVSNGPLMEVWLSTSTIVRFSCEACSVEEARQIFLSFTATGEVSANGAPGMVPPPPEARTNRSTDTGTNLPVPPSVSGERSSDQ